MGAHTFRPGFASGWGMGAAIGKAIRWWSTPPTFRRRSAQNLHLTERFTRVGPDEISCGFTLDDPTTCTRPWTAQVPMRRPQGEIFEYACQEGNYALADILRGARAGEAAKKELK